MSKYKCSICGYVYDAERGDPEHGVAPGTPWDKLPDGWVCPVCGAGKDAFGAEAATVKPAKAVFVPEKTDGMSYALMSVLCSNLARGTQKQYRAEESALWSELADYFHAAQKPVAADFAALTIANAEDGEAYAALKTLAEEKKDRGALRALVWTEKVTAALKSLYARYEKEGDAVLADTRIYVCEICGFVYIGNEPPAVCPVCKVPNFKMGEVRR